MTAMLPTRDAESVRLADVLTSSLRAVRGEPNRLDLAGVDSAIVVVVDGLGSANLRARSGHARTLLRGGDRPRSAWSTFPATTAAAIASLATGVEPGEHGLTGYTVYDRASQSVLNQLTGWNDVTMPESWQRRTTVFQDAAQLGLRAEIIMHPRYAQTGFSNAVLRGAQFVAAERIADRLATAVARSTTPGISYVYVSELDSAAHALGWESDRWLAHLEELDAAVKSAVATLPRRVGLLVTADHGVIDVPPHKHLLIDAVAPALLDGVAQVAGDPRVISLWLEPGATDADRDGLAAHWSSALGDAAWAVSRRQAVSHGLYGPVVASEVLDRIGDVLLIARKQIALYDSRSASAQSRAMVGQHGALSDEELRVPLLGFGAFG